MPLAPIRGAPPGAAIPEFPADHPDTGPMPAKAAPIPEDQHQAQRQAYTPIEISDRGLTLTFNVIPEQPAISRASMTIHVTARIGEQSGQQAIGYLRMSANAARMFLTDLRSGKIQAVAAGDEGGTIELTYRLAGVRPAFLVCDLVDDRVRYELAINQNFDMAAAICHLLTDLGV